MWMLLIIWGHRNSSEFFYEKPKMMLGVAMKGILNSPGCMYCYCYMLIVLGRFSQSQIQVWRCHSEENISTSET